VRAANPFFFGGRSARNEAQRVFECRYVSESQTRCQHDQRRVGELAIARIHRGLTCANEKSISASVASFVKPCPHSARGTEFS